MSVESLQMSRDCHPSLLSHPSLLKISFDVYRSLLTLFSRRGRAARSLLGFNSISALV